jgi:hypothetical protein
LEDTQIRYAITQIVDNGIAVTLSLIEDVELETISQQQLMLEAVEGALTDKEVKQQIKPILEALLRSQPQTLIKSYQQTVMQITLPKKRYQLMGSPSVGHKLVVDISMESRV